MRKIGLTGGIASGKSTVATLLRDMGITVIDADAIAHRIVEPGQPAWREIVDWLGVGVLTADEAIDRARLGEKVFADPDARKRLESIMHPKILTAIDEELSRCEKNGVQLVVLDVPLLYECGWQTQVDEVWLVYVTPEIQQSRLERRNRFTPEQAQARIRAQWSLDEKRARADVVIDNSGEIQETRQQIAALRSRILI